MLHNSRIAFYDEARYDPTYTIPLRNAFYQEMSKRFVTLVRLLKVSIVDGDYFGLGTNFLHSPTVIQRVINPLREGETISEFLNWLNMQMNGIFLNSPSASWIRPYIESAYQRGILRARQELIRHQFRVPPLRGIGEVIVVENFPFHRNKISLLYVRTYNELKGIVSIMEQLSGRILSQAITENRTPRQIALALVNGIIGNSRTPVNTVALSPRRRADIMTKTEIVRAHHVATIEEYRSWEVQKVRIKAERKKLGDRNPCNECSSLEGREFTLDEVQGMIPMHGLCRCVAVPVTIQ